jgi:hypothetical protein
MAIVVWESVDDSVYGASNEDIGVLETTIGEATPDRTFASFAYHAEVSRLVFVNRAWDTSAGAFVIWQTSGAPDIALGDSYPGPGSFGVDTESPFVVAILRE